MLVIKFKGSAMCMCKNENVMQNKNEITNATALSLVATNEQISLGKALKKSRVG